MRAVILLLCLCLSLAEITGVVGKRLRRSKVRGTPQKEKFAGDLTATNSSARALCLRGLINTCQVQGGVCVMKGKCARSARILHGIGCQPCTCCISAPPPTGCSPSQACSANFGVCSYQCLPGAAALPGLCGRPDCFCCVTGCHDTQPCIALHGKCISTHNTCVGTVKTGLCQGSGCVCCIPSLPPPTCGLDESCKHHDGVCKLDCTNNEKYIPGACLKKDCKCCVKGPECPPKKGCDRKNGVCRKYCHDDEEKHYEGCGHKGCVCCVRKHYPPPPNNGYNPPPHHKPDYKSEQGGGDEYRRRDVGGGNSGECSATQECLEKEGECRETCNTGEKELEGGCTGEAGCRCCFT
nr:uncharacterized protein LOC123769765 [Procambarus clarkii]